MTHGTQCEHPAAIRIQEHGANTDLLLLLAIFARCGRAKHVTRKQTQFYAAPVFFVYALGVQIAPISRVISRVIRVMIEGYFNEGY